MHLTRILSLVALCLFFCGCKIIIISGPTSVTVGETVTYVLDLSADSSSLAGNLVLAVAVPTDWQLQSSSYQATLNGEDVFGSGVVVGSGPCNVGTLPPSHQLILLEADRADLHNTVGGRATVEFLVSDQPTGEYEVLFTYGTGNECSPPAVVTLNRTSSPFLTPVQTLVDDLVGIDGLAGVSAIGASSNSEHIYVGGGLEGAVPHFSRSASIPPLAQQDVIVDGVGGATGLAMPMDIAVSADDQYLYVASRSNPETAAQGGVALFSRATGLRGAATGSLQFVERLLEDASNLVLSPDGAHLYAADSGVTLYERNQASGQLSFVETIFPGGKLMISPDGAHLYAFGSNEGMSYERDAATGRLTDLAFLFGVEVVNLSPDGRHLYILENFGHEFKRYERDAATGLLGSRLSISHGKPYNLLGETLAFSPEGSQAVLVSEEAILVYVRDAANGDLTLVESHYPYNFSISALDGSRALTFTPDGRHLLLGSVGDDTLLVFETSILFHDGFESGSTSAWQ